MHTCQSGRWGSTLSDSRSWKSCSVRPDSRQVVHAVQRHQLRSVHAALCTHSTVTAVPPARQAAQVLSGSMVLPLPGLSLPGLETAQWSRAADTPMYFGKHAVVCGAGPCGTLTAIFLAQQGFCVDVYEKRPAPVPNSQRTAGPRSFCIMLHRRGMDAIAEAGIVLPPSLCLKRGSVVRFRKSQMFSTEASPWSHSVNRDLLSSYLIDFAQDTFPGRVRFAFDMQLEALSVEDNTAAFIHTSSGDTVRCSYDLLVGADGANSKVRAEMARHIPGFAFHQVQDNLEYKTVSISPSCLDGLPSDYFTLYDEERNAFFVCARDAQNGCTRGVFVLSTGGFSNLVTEDDYFRSLAESFPAPFTEEQCRLMAHQLVQAPLCRGNLNTQCSQIWGPSLVLMGDAAHSMWPTLGQGVNAALEDAAVLNGVLKECKGDLGAVPQAFQESRHDDVLAVVDLTWMSYGAGRHAISTRSIIKTMLLSWAAKLLPWIVARPALTLMNETNMRYCDILKQQEREEHVLGAAAAGVEAVGIALAVTVLVFGCSTLNAFVLG